MRQLFILIASSISLACPASGDPESARTCRIVFPDRSQDAPRVVHLFDGESSREVALPSMNFSPVIELPAGELTILMSPGEITDPEDLPPGAPALVIAADVRDFYIFVTPDPENPTLPLKMNLVNASEGKLQPGETLWINLTNHTIVAQLGESEISVEPLARTVSKEPRSGSGYYKAELGYQTQGGEDTRKITEQQWWHDAESRQLGFIANTGGGLPRFQLVRDFR